MAAMVINAGAPFGGLTVVTVARLVQLQSNIERLNSAIAVASSGFQGKPGTQFEQQPLNLPPANGAEPNLPAMPNNFGVAPDPANPGAQGEAFSYAVGQLHQMWADFWSRAQPYVQALDQGATML